MSAAGPLPMSPSPSVATQRLEHFLDSVLRRDLQRCLASRDDCYSAASQCAQLRQLLADMADLGKVRRATVSVAADDVPESSEAARLASAGEEARGGGGGPSAAEVLAAAEGLTAANRRALAELIGSEGDERGGRTVLHKGVTVADGLVGDPAPFQLLCDVSGGVSAAAASPVEGEQQQVEGAAAQRHHFFMTAEVTNPAIVHINIGCGIVCPMTHEEATLFLKKREQLYRDASQRLSRESLRIRFRIRLVMEAITRLEDGEAGVVAGRSH